MHEESTLEEKEILWDAEDIISEHTTGIKVEQVTDEKPGELEVDETTPNSYVINSIEDLVAFAHNVTNGITYEGEIVKLGLSLDFNSNKSYVEPYRTDYVEFGYDGALKTLLTTGSGFIPIGPIENQSAKVFLGEFDGNNNTISNLYINQSVTTGTEYQFFGLFTQNYGIIKNLKVNGNIELNVTTNNVTVGLISGIAIGENGRVENCHSSGKINVNGPSLNTNYYIASGGIVGQINDSEVNKCSNEAEITTNGERIYVGGIAGSNNRGRIYASYNKGKIIGIGEDEILTRCGGIVGHFKGTIEYCYNIGEVKGYKLTGGILGGLVSGSIINCQYNNEDLLGTGSLTQEQEEENNIIRNEKLTEEDILREIETY